MICRQRRGSKGPLSPRASGAPLPTEGVQPHPLSPGGSGLPPTPEAGDVAVDIAPETIGSGGLKASSSVSKRDSFMDAKFYDAKSTNLPVFGKRITDDDFIEGPMEAEPQVCCAVLCFALLIDILNWGWNAGARVAVLCWAVLGWAVLCCAVLCCVVLCCAGLGCAVPCCAMLC